MNKLIKRIDDLESRYGASSLFDEFKRSRVKEVFSERNRFILSKFIRNHKGVGDAKKFKVNWRR